MKRLPSYLLIALMSAQCAILAVPAPSCPPECDSICSDCPSRDTDMPMCDERSSCCDEPAMKPRPCSTGSCCPSTNDSCSPSSCSQPAKSDCSTPCNTPCGMTDRWQPEQCMRDCRTDCNSPCAMPREPRSAKPNPTNCQSPMMPSCPAQPMMRVSDTLPVKLFKFISHTLPLYGLGFLYFLHLNEKNWIDTTSPDNAKLNEAINQFLKLGVTVWIFDRIKDDARALESIFFNVVDQVTV